MVHACFSLLSLLIATAAVQQNYAKGVDKSSRPTTLSIDAAGHLVRTGGDRDHTKELKVELSSLDSVDNTITEGAHADATRDSHIRRAAGKPTLDDEKAVVGCDPEAASLIAPKSGPHQAPTIPDHVSNSDDPCAKMAAKLTPSIMHGHLIKTDPATGEKVQVPEVDVTKTDEEITGEEQSAKARSLNFLGGLLMMFLCCAGCVLVAIGATRFSQERKASRILKEKKEIERQHEFEDAAATAAKLRSAAETEKPGTGRSIPPPVPKDLKDQLKSQGPAQPDVDF